MNRPTRGRAAARTAVTVAAALAAATCLPGAALAEPGNEIPEYVFADDAKAVKGTASSGDGPALEPGVYKDTIKRGQKKYYTVDLDAKSSAYFSAVAAPEPGSKVARFGEGIEISLKTVDGEECGGGPVGGEFGGQGAAYPIGTSVQRYVDDSDDADDSCNEKGPYLLSVTREGSGTSSPATWPLELSYREEPPLKGSAPGASGGTLPEEVPVPSVRGGRKPARGGTGFNDAGSVGSGLWKDRILPGETRFYRVPVDWGQKLHASAELGSSGRGGKYPPSVYGALGVSVYNPARVPLDDPEFTDYRDESAALPLITPAVSYGNRFADEVPGMSASGWYYLAVTVSPKLAEKYFPGGKKVPLTLRVDVDGKARKGPSYAGDAQEAGFGVTDEDRDQAAKGQSAAGAAEDGSKKLLAFAGIGAGAVLLLGLGGWTLLARRRATAAPAAPPPPPPSGYGPPPQ